MSIKELHLQTGLSQSKFANMFDVPVATLKDWEQDLFTKTIREAADQSYYLKFYVFQVVEER